MRSDGCEKKNPENVNCLHDVRGYLSRRILPNRQNIFVKIKKLYQNTPQKPLFIS